MLGVGETSDDIRKTLHDLRSHDVDVVTFGQYLRPSRRHLSVQRYVTPEEFKDWQREAEGMGFKYVASGPLVRSSYKVHQRFFPSSTNLYQAFPLSYIHIFFPSQWVNLISTYLSLNHTMLSIVTGGRVFSQEYDRQSSQLSKDWHDCELYYHCYYIYQRYCCYCQPLTWLWTRQ